MGAPQFYAVRYWSAALDDANVAGPGWLPLVSMLQRTLLQAMLDAGL